MLQSRPEFLQFMAGNWKKAVKTLDAPALKDYALKLLGGRALSLSELREKLKRKASNPDDVPGVIASLKEYGVIDDEQFADSFAAARRDNQGFGKMRVLRDLRARRVAPGVADRAVSRTFAEVNETEQIEQYLARKYRSVVLGTWLKEEKNLASAFRRLRYAGFSAGNAIRVLKRYSSQADQLEEDPEE